MNSDEDKFSTSCGFLENMINRVLNEGLFGLAHMNLVEYKGNAFNGMMRNDQVAKRIDALNFQLHKSSMYRYDVELNIVRWSSMSANVNTERGRNNITCYLMQPQQGILRLQLGEPIQYYKSSVKQFDLNDIVFLFDYDEDVCMDFEFKIHNEKNTIYTSEYVVFEVLDTSHNEERKYYETISKSYLTKCIDESVKESIERDYIYEKFRIYFNDCIRNYNIEGYLFRVHQEHSYSGSLPDTPANVLNDEDTRSGFQPIFHPNEQDDHQSQSSGYQASPAVLSNFAPSISNPSTPINQNDINASTEKSISESSNTSTLTPTSLPVTPNTSPQKASQPARLRSRSTTPTSSINSSPRNNANKLTSTGSKRTL